MKKFEYKNLFMGNLSELNALGIVGWEMCGNMGDNIILKREREKSFFLEVFDDEEKGSGLRFYDWEDGQLDEMVGKIGDSRFSYIILCGDFTDNYDTIEEIHVYNQEINLDDAREGLNGFCGLKVWKFDYEKKLLEEVFTPFETLINNSDNIIKNFKWGIKSYQRLCYHIANDNVGYIMCEMDEKDKNYVLDCEAYYSCDGAKNNIIDDLKANVDCRAWYFNCEENILEEVEVER